MSDNVTREQLARIRARRAERANEDALDHEDEQGLVDEARLRQEARETANVGIAARRTAATAVYDRHLHRLRQMLPGIETIATEVDAVTVELRHYAEDHRDAFPEARFAVEQTLNVHPIAKLLPWLRLFAESANSPPATARGTTGVAPAPHSPQGQEQGAAGRPARNRAIGARARDEREDHE